MGCGAIAARFDKDSQNATAGRGQGQKGKAIHPCARGPHPRAVVTSRRTHKKPIMLWHAPQPACQEPVRIGLHHCPSDRFCRTLRRCCWHAGMVVLRGEEKRLTVPGKWHGSINKSIPVVCLLSLVLWPPSPVYFGVLAVVRSTQADLQETKAALSRFLRVVGKLLSVPESMAHPLAPFWFLFPSFSSFPSIGLSRFAPHGLWP